MIKLRVDGRGVRARIERVLTKIVDRDGHLAAERLFKALVTNTPVDTGYARSRWTFNVNEEFNVRYEITGGPVFKEFRYTLSNDAPYMIYLNQGWSKQAPAYFIESTILSQGFDIKNTVVKSNS